MIPIGRLAPLNQWDTTVIDRLIDGELYPTGLTFKRYGGYPPNTDGCVLVVPGRYWADATAEINNAIASYRWVLFIRTSDEEDRFDVGKVEHPNIRFWVQTPRADRDYSDARLFGCGYTPHFAKLPIDPPVKDLDVVLCGQNTHARRNEAFAALGRIRTDAMLIEPTSGFTRGLIASAYVDAMLRTKVAPASSGAVSPDSFRLFEALESHCVPIADDISPGENYDSRGYWSSVLPGAPFPVFTDCADLPKLVDEALADWPSYANRVTAWWMREKRRMAIALRHDLKMLGAL